MASRETSTLIPLEEGTRSVATDAVKAEPWQFGTTLLQGVVVVATIGVLAGFAITFGVHVGGGGLSENHLTSSEKERANDGVYEVDTIQSPDDGDVVIDGPVRFLSDSTFGPGDSVLLANESIEVFIETLVADTIRIPNPLNGTETILLNELIQDIVEFCDVSLTDDVTQIIQEITTIIDNISFEVIEYQDDLITYYASFDARNATFHTNQQRINDFNATCSSTDIDTFVSTYNATEDAINLLIINHNINVLNYTIQYDRYQNLTNVTDVFLTANCSGIFDLAMDVEKLYMDYNASVIQFNTTQGECEDCAAETSVFESTFNTLLLEETVLDARIDQLDNQTQQLGATSNTLYSEANQTLTLAQNITNELTTLLTNYIALNQSLSDLKTNATILEGLASTLNSSYIALNNDVEGLNTTISDVQVIVETLITNCTAVNITNVQNLINDLNTAIANITTVLNSTQTQIGEISVLSTNITDLDTQLDVIETTIATISTIYDDSLARFILLNATFTSYSSIYNDEVTRFLTFVTLYNDYSNRTVDLATDFNTVQTTLSGVETALTTNDGDLTTNEARIVALEPDLCPGVATNFTFSTQSIGFTASARQNMSAGMPITLDVGATGVATPARGPRYQDSRVLGNLANLTAFSDGDLALGNGIVDSEDFLYHAFPIKANRLAAYEFDGVSITIDPANEYIEGLNCVIVKTSPSKELVWAAHIGGSVNEIECIKLRYDVFSDSIWVGFNHRNIAGVAPIANFTVELFDYGRLDTPRFTYFQDVSFDATYDAINVGLAQISRSGRWMHVEHIVQETTPSTEGRGIRDMDTDGDGNICGNIYVDDVTVLLNFGSGQIVLNATTPTNSVLWCYNIPTYSFLWARSIQDQPRTGPLSSFEKGTHAVAIDTANNMYVLTKTHSIVGTGFGNPVNFTLADGSVTTLITQSFGELDYIARVSVFDGSVKWVQQFWNSDGIRCTLRFGFLAALQKEIAFGFDRNAGGALWYGSQNKTVATVPYDALIGSVDKHSGELINSFRAPLQFNRHSARQGMVYHDKANDHLHMMTQTDTFGGSITVLGEDFGITSKIGGATQPIPNLHIRLDGDIMKLGSLTDIPIQRAGGNSLYLGSIAVNSHGNFYMLAGGLGPYDNVQSRGSTGLNHGVLFQNTSTDLYGYLSFSQEDHWPLGILTEDAIRNENTNVVMRGLDTFPGVFAAPDIGTIFHEDVPSGNTISNTRVGGDAQIGFATNDVPDFIVDIHTTPLIGSDQ